jgi:hypothetical protein
VTGDDNFIVWTAPFTMENCLKAKARRRRELINLPIDEKIKIVESLRERAEVIRRWKKAHGRA